MRRLSLTLISFYQRRLSPYKGFCCAHHALTGEPSCSEFARITITERGLIKSLPLIAGQFTACRESLEKLKQDIKKDWRKNDCTSLTHCGGESAACCCGAWF